MISECRISGNAITVGAVYDRACALTERAFYSFMAVSPRTTMRVPKS